MRYEGLVCAMLAMALGLGGCATQPGTATTDGGDDSATGIEVTKGTEVPTDSILSFDGDAGSARLVADMEAGRVPTECDVLYDEEGMLPPVTVTDADGISEIYRLLAEVTVVGKSDMSVTDGYHFVSFALQDGPSVSFCFEGDSIVHRDDGNYEVEGAGPLWAHIRNLQAEITGSGHAYAVSVVRDDTNSIEDCPTNAEGGSWASFVCTVGDDEEVHAFVNDKEIQKVSPTYIWVGGSDEKTPTGKKKFEFYMPDEPVEIKVILGEVES